MDLGIKDRVALVAASSKGLGRAVAWALAREGAKLVLCSRDKEALEQTADEIFLNTGVSVFPLCVDLSEAGQIDWLMEETLDLYGRVDVLVTNAGGPRPGDFEAVDEADWGHAVQLTLMSVVRLCRAVIPSMKRNGWGRIINLTSVSARQPLEGLLLSNALRPGVVGLTKSLSQELAPHNILVNAVCPGYIQTDRVVQLLEAKAKQTGRSVEELMQERIDDIPLGRIGKPEELAQAVAFLASERASYITGVTLPVDGGYIKGL